VVKPILVIVLLVTTAVLAIPFLTKPKTIPQELLAVLRPNPVDLQQFTFIDQDNKSFTLNNLKDKNSLLFFGYMSCPDICPTTLTTMNMMLNKLTTQSSTYPLPQVIFISVDPARDNPDKIAEYMSYFNKSFIGLTGSKHEIDQFTKQFGAGYMMDKSSSTENYLVNHTSSIFMVNSKLQLVASFSPPHNADTLVSQYKLIVDLHK